MLRLAALPVLATVLIFSGSASAWTPKGWRTSVGIARMSWPDSPCSGREQVAVIDHMAPDHVGEGYQDGSCRVNVSAGLSNDELCIVLVHEFGHLAGRSHADVYDHEGIMAPGSYFYSPCADALAPPTPPRTMAARYFGLPPSRCTLAAATPTRRLYRCGRHAHAEVTIAPGLMTASRV